MNQAQTSSVHLGAQALKVIPHIVMQIQLYKASECEVLQK
jgi:hypothetical protein